MYLRTYVFIFVVPVLEFRAYTLARSTSPFRVRSFPARVLKG